ncbi:MAG: MFS transporter [Mycoplasmataceae bacterium]|nr:MFS transporter [Mycoplasmataceae bacterium]
MQYLPIYINVAIIVLAIIIAIVVIRFIKINQKGYKLLFVCYTLFWIPLMLLRQYTGVMEKAIDSKMILLWLPLASYGFIGIFARLFADWFAFKTRSRKSMIYLALFIGLITYIPIIIYPCTTTNVIQSLGVGVGASMIGTYQLLFNEQYGKSKQFLTVSILSIPPLLADFISSAIQSTFSSVGSDSVRNNSDILKYMWLVGLVVIIATFIVAYFVKEDRQRLYKDDVYKKQIKTSREWIYFVYICFLGSLIAFIKWANSGSIAQLHIEVLAGYAYNPQDPINFSCAGSYEGYLSLLFSLGQLFGGLITGLFLINKIGKLWSFTIGCAIWIIYEVAGIYTLDSYAYLGIHVLNGLSYGIIYNLILGFVLQKTFNQKKLSPMAIYQSVMSIGITGSSFFISWLKQVPLGEKNYDSYFHAATIINWTIVGVIVVAWFIFVYTWLIEKMKISKTMMI